MSEESSAATRAAVNRRVPFHDVDPARMVWHGHYPRYLEDARCALLEKIGYSYADMEASGHVWPVVDLRISYKHPMRYDQAVVITADLLEWEYRLRIGYEIRDANSNRLLTRARTDQVPVRIDSGEWLVGSPRVLLDRVAAVRGTHG